VTAGKQLPAATFTTGRGERVTVADLKGEPAVINFWATWCAPCREEIPILQEAHAANPNVQFLAVTDELATTVRPFADQLKMTLPVWYDPGGKAGKAYGIQSIPQTFFLDGEGTIVARHVGALSAEQLANYLTTLKDGERDRIPTPLPSPDEGEDHVGAAPRQGAQRSAGL
jgi:thiol-disulfide isomerase/thioredoxin